jgi:2-polyprenyl-6-methoxyphenol hydroxylase-like FAD-dependent oxidoreductase
MSSLTENELRAVIERSKLCTIRTNCEVIAREEFEDHVVTAYRRPDGSTGLLRSDWLVAADGKRGIVRKKFLEPVTDIRQLSGKYLYERTWIIANLRLTLPTPETHPDFPLWSIGLTPKQVYDLFWPKDWHFCSPPGPPTACGRIGRYDDFLWRHEIAPERIDNDPQMIIMGHILSIVTRTIDEAGNKFPGPVTYPEDCIEILRCEAVNFVQKTVNKWFHNRTILVGDAAHVFPPFAGQGITCGAQDAFTLAWRLGISLRGESLGKEATKSMLDQWAYERAQDVENRVFSTKLSGNLCNGSEPWLWYGLRQVAATLSRIPSLKDLSQVHVSVAETIGLRCPEKAFHLSKSNGGYKVAQIRLRRRSSGALLLSDELLCNGSSILTLIVLADDNQRQRAMVRGVIENAGLDPAILSPGGVRFVDLGRCWTEVVSTGGIRRPEVSLHSTEGRDVAETFYPNTKREAQTYQSRIGKATKYAVIRPDFVVFGTAEDINELAACIRALSKRLS